MARIDKLNDMKDELHQYLRIARQNMLWKLDGLTEYQKRRPMTPTGTNLLGLVKHLAIVEYGYFGLTFGREFPAPFAKLEAEGTARPNSDMWATAEESSESIVALYRKAWEHSDKTIDAHELDSFGRVLHWPVEKQEVTLHRVLVQMIAETNRHAGHARHRARTHRPDRRNASWQREHGRRQRSMVGTVPNRAGNRCARS